MVLFELMAVFTAVCWMIGGLYHTLRGEMTIRYSFFLEVHQKRITGPAVMIWSVGQVVLGGTVLVVALFSHLSANANDPEAPFRVWKIMFGLSCVYALIMLPVTALVYRLTRDKPKGKPKRKRKNDEWVPEDETGQT
jgi:hypothetical protein